MNVRDLIKRHEGLRLKVYLDTLGFATIGYGHKLIKNEYSEISLQMAEELLDQDILIAEDGLTHIFPWWHLFSDNRQAALIDMVFQLGVGGLSHFKKAIEHVRKSEWEAAADDFFDSLWAKQTPARAEEDCKLIREG